VNANFNEEENEAEIVEQFDGFILFKRKKMP